MGRIETRRGHFNRGNEMGSNPSSCLKITEGRFFIEDSVWFPLTVKTFGSLLVVTTAG